MLRTLPEKPRNNYGLNVTVARQSGRQLDMVVHYPNYNNASNEGEKSIWKSSGISSNMPWYYEDNK